MKTNEVSFCKMNEVSLYKTSINFLVFLITLVFALNAIAAADLEVNTPGVNAIKQKMQARHTQLSEYYTNGAIGLTVDGMIGVRDASAVPLAQRYTVNVLVAAENQDRNALYAEIAQANGHPEWQDEIRSIFAQRWIDRAQRGWWVQIGDGWIQK